MVFFISLCSSRNSIYSIHYTYYSLAVSGLLSTFFITLFLFVSECYMFNSKYNLVVFILLVYLLGFDLYVWFCYYVALFLFIVYLICSLCLVYSICLLLLLVFLFFVPFSYAALCFILIFLAFFLFMWINDIITESSFVFTRTEQFGLIFGIKLLILSELGLFFSLFWAEINFRFILSVFSCFFSMPLLSSFSFAIPYTNVVVLLFSSLPIQATIILYKVGLFFERSEQLGQTVSCGSVFLILQLKEFFYSFHSITDCMVGSIFYFTTGLHGAHVLFGLFYFYLILLLYCFNMLFTFSVTFFSTPLSVLFSITSNAKQNALFSIKRWALNKAELYLALLSISRYGELDLNQVHHSAALFTFYVTIFSTLPLFSLLFSIYYLTWFKIKSNCLFCSNNLAKTAFYLPLLVMVNKTLNKAYCLAKLNNTLRSLYFTFGSLYFTYFFIEFSESLFYSPYHRHFVDIIRLVVFIPYFFPSVLFTITSNGK